MKITNKKRGYIPETAGLKRKFARVCVVYGVGELAARAQLQAFLTRDTNKSAGTTNHHCPCSQILRAEEATEGTRE